MMNNDISYPNLIKLEWAADIALKIRRLNQAINYNSIPIEHKIDIEILKDFFKKDVDALSNKINRELDTLVREHPAWHWLQKVDGINPALMGHILGSVRLWPPDGRKVNEMTGKERWAHSRGALLMYCGMVTGKRNDMNFSTTNIIIKDCVFEQVKLFIDKKNGYYSYFMKQTNDQYALKNTVILFLNHIWEVTRKELKLAITPPFMRDGEVYVDPMEIIKVSVR